MLFVPVAVGTAVALLIGLASIFFVPGPDKAYVTSSNYSLFFNLMPYALARLLQPQPHGSRDGNRMLLVDVRHLPTHYLGVAPLSLILASLETHEGGFASTCLKCFLWPRHRGHSTIPQECKASRFLLILLCPHECILFLFFNLFPPSWETSNVDLVALSAHFVASREGTFQ